MGDLLFLLAHEESVTPGGVSTFLSHRFNHSVTQPRTSDSPVRPKMESLRRGYHVCSVSQRSGSPAIDTRLWQAYRSRAL